MSDHRNTPNSTAESAANLQSWLASCVFLFTALYQHLSLSATFLTLKVVLFVIVGLLVARAGIDYPAQYLNRTIALRLVADRQQADRDRALDKAGAIATFIKAAQVILAFMATKWAYGWYFG